MGVVSPIWPVVLIREERGQHTEKSYDKADTGDIAMDQGTPKTTISRSGQEGRGHSLTHSYLNKQNCADMWFQVRSF